MKRKLTLQERAARASDRLANRGCSRIWDNAHDGYLVGYRAAKRDARKGAKELKRQISELKRQISELKLRLKTAQEINTYEANRANRFESALRAYARGAVDETRPHPFKELRP